jgi:xanthine dehydrogenase YagR molybdenum-binding subunit
VPRLLGVFAAGRIVNPVTARSQLIGGMTMGLSMALFEESTLDPEFGDFPNHDLASYHIAACADVGDIDAVWIDEDEPNLGPAGAKGIGEIGIVGTAAATPTRYTTPPALVCATSRSGWTSSSGRPRAS